MYLSVDPCDRPDAFTVERPYERATSIGSVVVPVGFETDLASTPWQMWRKFPTFGRFSGAALVHDFFYRTRPPGVTRYRADRIFYELMRRDGVWRGTAEAMFQAVRSYGARAWNRK